MGQGPGHGTGTENPDFHSVSKSLEPETLIVLRFFNISSEVSIAIILERFGTRQVPQIHVQCDRHNCAMKEQEPHLNSDPNKIWVIVTRP